MSVSTRLVRLVVKQYAILYTAYVRDIMLSYAGGDLHLGLRDNEFVRHTK